MAQCAGLSSTVSLDQDSGVDQCCMLFQQPGWDAGPLWNGRLQLAGSVSSTVQYDCRVIKELWAAVHLQTGLLHMPMCIFIRLGSIVGGRARSAMFSACKATRGLCALVVSTNLHIELQVGMFNQGFGQCMDTLSALCGREYMRASNRRVDNGVLKIHIHPFPCPQLDVLHLQASDPEGGPCSWVVKLDGSTVASEDSELFSRFRRELPDGTAVLHFNGPTHHSRESFFSVDAFCGDIRTWSGRFVRGEVSWCDETSGNSGLNPLESVLIEWGVELQWVIPSGIGSLVEYYLRATSDPWFFPISGQTGRSVEGERVLQNLKVEWQRALQPGWDHHQPGGPGSCMVQLDRPGWWREYIFRGGYFSLQWVSSVYGVHVQGGPCPPGNFGAWAELVSDNHHRAKMVVENMGCVSPVYCMSWSGSEESD